MKRRELIILLGGLAIWSGAARAQQPDRVRRVGVLMGIADDLEGQARIAVFRQALQALGWTEGRNIQLIYRWSVGDAVQARRFAKELLDLRSDVILVNSNFDPLTADKWLELLKRVAPNITRVAYLFNPSTAPHLYARAVETAAPLFSVKPFPAAVHDVDEIERTIEQISRESDSALLVLPDLFTATNRESIIALAARYRLPAVYPFRYFAADGGLMSYGTEVLDTYRQAASYVDRILKGEKPSDLPVQQPTKFEFVINLKTAKALGLDVPRTLLARADEVIE
jgi:putative tryptophan/tyrosine transport system substrate-binding protein